MLVCEVKEKLHNFGAYSCGSLYSTSKTSFLTYAYYKKIKIKLFLNTNLSNPRQRVPLK